MPFEWHREAITESPQNQYVVDAIDTMVANHPNWSKVLTDHVPGNGRKYQVYRCGTDNFVGKEWFVVATQPETGEGDMWFTLAEDFDANFANDWDSGPAIRRYIPRSYQYGNDLRPWPSIPELVDDGLSNGAGIGDDSWGGTDDLGQPVIAKQGSHHWPYGTDHDGSAQAEDARTAGWPLWHTLSGTLPWDDEGGSLSATRYFARIGLRASDDLAIELVAVISNDTFFIGTKADNAGTEGQIYMGLYEEITSWTPKMPLFLYEEGDRAGIKDIYFGNGVFTRWEASEGARIAIDRGISEADVKTAWGAWNGYNYRHFAIDTWVGLINNGSYGEIAGSNPEESIEMGHGGVSGQPLGLKPDDYRLRDHGIKVVMGTVPNLASISASDSSPSVKFGDETTVEGNRWICLRTRSRWAQIEETT